MRSMRDNEYPHEQADGLGLNPFQRNKANNVNNSRPSQGLYNNLPTNNNNNRFGMMDEMDDEDMLYETEQKHNESNFMVSPVKVQLCLLFFFFLAVLGVLFVSVGSSGLHLSREKSELESLLEIENSTDDSSVAGKSKLSNIEIPQMSLNPSPKQPFQYPHLVDPFQFSSSSSYASLFNPPTIYTSSDKDEEQEGGKAKLPPPLGYLSQPCINNNTLVFVSEGDLYLSRITEDIPSSAVKLTNTVGNVISPKINPKYPYLIAFSATYTGSREVYLMDLRQNYRTPAYRLTYLPDGIYHIIEWSEDGQSILFSTHNHEVGMPNVKIYKIFISTTGMENHKDESSMVSVGSIESLPIAQAVDAVEYDSCFYFVRYKQSSHTYRYIGGTTENLWGYCDSYDYTVHLYPYIGTTKSPKIYQKKYLLFISDRYYEDENDDLKMMVANLNLFVVPIPTENDMYTKKKTEIVTPVQLTAISCEEENGGRQLMEYDIDEVTGNIVLRVGADLKILYAEDIQKTLSKVFHTSKNDRKNMNFRSLNEEAEKSEKPNKKKNVNKKDDNDEKKNNANHDEKKQTNADESDGNNDSKKTNDINDNNDSKKTNGKDANKETQKTNGKDDINDSLKTKNSSSAANFSVIQSKPLPLALYSDFNLRQERRFSGKIPHDVGSVDVFGTVFDQNYALVTIRGQGFVSPILSTGPSNTYTGMGELLPVRGYKLIPSSSLGGITRVLAMSHIPSNDNLSTPKALVLATDPLSETSEHALYILPCDSTHAPFFSIEDIPIPILGGHTSTGGSAKDGGLGSIKTESLVVSPCGRRAAWADTDGRITVMTIPTEKVEEVETFILPQQNNRGEPIVGVECELSWSPAGRYLAIEHPAQNQFSIISIADLSDPAESSDGSDSEEDEIEDDKTKPKLVLKEIVQATPSRFNSGSVYWGRSVKSAGETTATSPPSDTLYFLTDRDIISDVTSPWGTRAPSPHFKKDWVVYALPLDKKIDEDENLDTTKLEARSKSPFYGGGASELGTSEDLLLEYLKVLMLEELMEEQMETNTTNETETTDGDTLDLQKVLEALVTPITPDIDIDFGGDASLEVFARKAYRIASIPAGRYREILSQVSDGPSLLLLDYSFQAILFEYSSTEAKFIRNEIPTLVAGGGTSTDRDYVTLVHLTGVKVVPNTMTGMTDLISASNKNFVDDSNLIISIQPSLEYQQMYADAWRLLRDYFYDPNMHGVDWDKIFYRYKPLVSRCAKREELDDVLAQMAAELSALHVFVYGGEYGDPTHGSEDMENVNHVASLGATVLRDDKLGGYLIQDVHIPDPDFATLDGTPIFSPLSEKVMRLSGQKGLQPGDVISYINGESVIGVPDMHMLLRGQAGQSVRLEVRREGGNTTEPVIVVPIRASQASDLRYSAWEYRTRLKATKLAKESGFTCGYIHLRDMDGIKSIDAFTRDFFPNYNKQTLIIDVRHNRGGNIDSWLLTALQRQAWTYWQGRATNLNNGGLGWDEQFAFRGHIVVLVDEGTSSDGEGFSRGIMELGLGKTIGTKTWGGGIWLSSDNGLVDGGIATAPEIGTYNDNWGWGMGIENEGVEPDIEIDNDPRQVETGHDAQLVKAIEVLKDWLVEEPVVLPKRPGPHPDKSLSSGSCANTK